MAKFKRRTWVNRIVEFANRYKMTDMETGEVSTINLNRLPGTVTQAGDAVSAENLNDLEDRIEEALNQYESGMQSYVTSAQKSAGEAAASATSASDAASAAGTAESSANNAAAVAESSAQVAQNEASNAGKSADTAQESAASAVEAAGTAQEAALRAAEYATSDYAVTAQSWAVGGTGSRDGEDSDNAKYYAERASDARESAQEAQTAASDAKASAEAAAKSAEQAGAAVVGVSSWNGRGGAVMPAAGDYAAEQIATASGSNVETELSSKASQADLTNLQTTINETVNKNIEELQTDLSTVSGKVDSLDSSTSANFNTISEDLTSVTDKLVTLIGTDTGKSVRTIADEELAAQLIPENAKESLDTLQEIAAWIQSHPDDAAAMNEELVALKQRITNIHSYKEVTITSSGWSASKNADGYYTYTIDGLTIYDENPEIFLKGSNSVAWSQKSAYMAVDKAETGDSSITLYTAQTGLKNFTILIKGVA